MKSLTMDNISADIMRVPYADKVYKWIFIPHLPCYYGTEGDNRMRHITKANSKHMARTYIKLVKGIARIIADFPDTFMYRDNDTLYIKYGPGSASIALDELDKDILLPLLVEVYGKPIPSTIAQSHADLLKVA